MPNPTDDEIQAQADALLDQYLADPVEDDGTDDADDREMAERARWDRILDRAITADDEVEHPERFEQN